MTRRPTTSGVLNTVVALEFAAALGWVLFSEWERGLLFAVAGFVFMLLDDNVKLCRRLDELEDTVDKMTRTRS